MKLYPPYIEGKLPAFIKAAPKTKITIPFQLNPLVGVNDIDKMVLVLKTISGQQVRGVIEGEPYYVYEENNQDIFRGYVDFILPDKNTEWPTEINIGQHYKAQVAFKKGSDIGYYSSVGIIKCIAQPTCNIEGLKTNEVVANPFSFTGVYNYDSSADNEKLYSCCFNIYDEDYNVYDTSGDIVHSANKTDGKDTWELNKNLQPNKIYYVQYSYLTQSNYQGSTLKYPIIEGLFDSADKWYNDLVLEVEAKNESGKNIVKVKQPVRPPEKDKVLPVNGSYKIVRTSNESNYTDWVDLFEFSVADQYISKPLVWEDYFLTHGVKYKYAIQRYNPQGVRLERGCISVPVLADFDDMFLFDGERQLRLAFNPKVSSFKTTILENKVDTLGGSYPFFYRNGNVAYKEFPISALISINMDENFDFLDEKKVNQLLNLSDGDIASKRGSTPSKINKPLSRNTELSTDNIRMERNFKMEVLNWLNDGKPKLFRSAVEGNFLVRLMNVSLSPNDTLGRMIHTFNANAYEIDTCDIRSLLKKEAFKPKTQALDICTSEDIVITNTEYKLPYNTHYVSLTVTGAADPKIDKFYRKPTTLEWAKEVRFNPVNAVYGKATWKELPSLLDYGEGHQDETKYCVLVNENEVNRAYYNYIYKNSINLDSFEIKTPLTLEMAKVDSLNQAYYIHSITVEGASMEKTFIFYNPSLKEPIIFNGGRAQGKEEESGKETVLINERANVCTIENPHNLSYILHCYKIKGGAQINAVG